MAHLRSLASTATIVILLTTAVFLTACGSSGFAATAPVVNGFPENTPTRPAPPQDYAGKENPFISIPKRANQGKNLFEADCASCHGLSARGDGPVSPSLDPKPGDLAVDQSSLSDAYLYWRIAEGGLIEPFRSGMPGWKGLLTEDQIWEVITYIRMIGAGDESGSGS